MDINDIYDEWFITDYLFGYNNSELYFIQDDDNINMDNDTQLMENNEINDDSSSLTNSYSSSPSSSPSPIYSPSPQRPQRPQRPQLMENCEINDHIYSSRAIKNVWSIKILNLNAREINKYIKKNNLTHMETIELKKERRRYFNRIYARNSREKKKEA
jgi:hypothetical protein